MDDTGRPYLDFPALKKGDRIGYQRNGGPVVYGTILEIEGDQETGDEVTITFQPEEDDHA